MSTKLFPMTYDINPESDMTADEPNIVFYCSVACRNAVSPLDEVDNTKMGFGYDYPEDQTCCPNCGGMIDGTEIDP